MMSKKLESRGRHIVLPIAGDTLVNVHVGIRHSPALIFRADDGGEAELTMNDCATLRRGAHERLLEIATSGRSFHPKELAPLLELLGSTVTDALAEKEGLLRMTFSNKLVLEVVPTHGYEAWHFQCPRPGRRPGGTPGRPIALHGAHGHLI